MRARKESNQRTHLSLTRVFSGQSKLLQTNIIRLRRLTGYPESLLGAHIVRVRFSRCHFNVNLAKQKCIQSTLVISNSRGLSEKLRDIRTSTYQIFRIEEKIIRTTTFNKFVCNWTLRDTYIENNVEKRRNCSWGAISPLFHNIFYLLLDFHV